MKNMFLTIVTAGFLSLYFPTLGFTAGCVDNGCHQDLVSTRYQHGPVAAEPLRPGGCTMCHVPDGRQCSKTKGGRFTMQSKGMCLKCHDRGTATKHSSGNSNCLECHDPHGSDSTPHFLRK